MNYINTEVRRKDRLLDEKDALHLLTIGEYGILSMNVNEDEAYGIPLNFVWDKKDSIYFHCAPEGKKLRILKENNNVSFCVVGPTKVISNKFTTQYESIIIKGKALLDLSDKEKMCALQLIIDKYSPNDKEIGKVFMDKYFKRTAIIRLDIQEISGKCRGI